MQNAVNNNYSVKIDEVETKLVTDDNFMQAEARLKTIKKTYFTAKREGDKNVYFINGKKVKCRTNTRFG